MQAAVEEPAPRIEEPAPRIEELRAAIVAGGEALSALDGAEDVESEVADAALAAEQRLRTALRAFGLRNNGADEQLVRDGRKTAQDLYYQRTLIRSPPERILSYAINVPENLTLAQLRAALAHAEQTDHEHRHTVRMEVLKRVPLEEALELLKQWPGPQLSHHLRSHHSDQANEALATRLKKALKETAEGVSLNRVISCADAYLRHTMPEGFRGYSEADVLSTSGGDGWDEYREDVDYCYLPVRKALTAARKRKEEEQIAGQAEAVSRRVAARREAGLPAELPERPAEHLCPLTFEPMLDPVVAADGITYEREAIEQWIQTGKVVSPLTRQDLSTDELRENIALRKLIRDFEQSEHDKMLHLARRLAPPGDGSKRLRAA